MKAWFASSQIQNGRRWRDIWHILLVPSSQINSSGYHSIKGRTRLGAIPSAYSLHYRLVYNAIRSHWSVSQTSLFWLFWKSSRATFSFIQILLPFMELVSAAFAPYRVRPYLIPCSPPHFSSSTPSSRVLPLIEWIKKSQQRRIFLWTHLL